ncbi:MAG: DUF309 domain-containing protein [Actinobacteria bacterium]|nr:DUF309 domain-containing protein [Actinomycetota bacterium]
MIADRRGPGRSGCESNDLSRGLCSTSERVIVDDRGINGQAWRCHTGTVTDTHDRDRDRSGRPLNARPRDSLGRPLPHGSTGVPGVDESKRRDSSQTLKEADTLLRRSRPFHAHEVLEMRWKSCPEPQRELWQGLAQLCVGITHIMRGNQAGAESVLERSRGNLGAYQGQMPVGLDLPAVMAWIDTTRSRLPSLLAQDIRALAPPKLWLSAE